MCPATCKRGGRKNVFTSFIRLPLATTLVNSKAFKTFDTTGAATIASGAGPELEEAASDGFAVDAAEASVAENATGAVSSTGIV